MGTFSLLQLLLFAALFCATLAQINPASNSCQLNGDQCSYNINLAKCDGAEKENSLLQAARLMSNMTTTLTAMQAQLRECKSTPNTDTGAQLLQVTISMKNLERNLMAVQTEMTVMKRRMDKTEQENAALKSKVDHLTTFVEGSKRFLGTNQASPASSCLAIKKANSSYVSGLYWIVPPGEEPTVAETYCDMKYDGGGWALASYGYIGRVGTQPENRNIPNMNSPHGYNWKPNNRISSHGVINLEHGAAFMARDAREMIMAGGGNPNSGGIDEYTYIYKIDISKQTYPITFKNHNAVHGATHGMHLQGYTVKALKGETGTATRYGLAEALGASWSDTYPTGYGFTERQHTHSGNFDKGPFFPSVHSGDKHAPCSRSCQDFLPDVHSGSVTYNHRGWYSLNGVGKTGQMSIWFR